MAVWRTPAPALEGYVSSYVGFTETAPGPVRRREGPGRDVVLIVSLEHEWLIDDVRHTSFAGGLRESQVTTEHAGRSHGLQINLSPLAARALFRSPMHELAERVVDLDDVGEAAVAERVAELPDWDARFELLDAVLTRRFANAQPPARDVAWAWQRLCETHGRVRVRSLAEELGWSGKRIVARFREHVGLPPKAVARLLRFHRARELALASERPDWARIAAATGYYDQSHLSRDFVAVTGRPPATFFQDERDALA